MFGLIHKSLREKINLNPENRNKNLNFFLSKHPTKRAEFSSLKKSQKINTNKKNNEIKTNYNIEDTRFFEGLLISLTSIGTIFIYEIYSKTLKKITCFATDELRAKGIHINSIRKSFIVTIFSHINNINNIQCFEIPIEFLIIKEKIKINDFSRILQSEEFLDSECYVQFDEFNKVILTRNILRTNKIWNFKNYSKNFEFTYSNLNEIRLTGGACLICEKTNEIRKYNIHVFDVNNGNKLYGNKIIFKPDKKIIFFELIMNYLFVKQQDNYPLYIDLLTNNIKIIKEHIDNEALFIYFGNTNKFILVSLDRYLIFDIKGDLLKKIINNNLSVEINQNDISSPINFDSPFVICWHLANVSFSKTDSDLRGTNSLDLSSSLSKISLANSNSNKKNKDSEICDFNMISPIPTRENLRSNIGAGVGISNFDFNLHSPLSSNNPNNIGFMHNEDILNEYSIDEIYGEHQIDIVYLDNINYIRSIKFKFDFLQKISSVNYIKETNSIFIITSFGEIYEIKL